MVTPTCSVSSEMKEKISGELGNTLADLVQVADFLKTQEKLGKLDDPFFERWFGIVEKQGENISDYIEEISRMLHSA